MDYEKAYKEALKRAKSELNVWGSIDYDAYKHIVRIFPELAESEDEKIRKEVIETINGTLHPNSKKRNELIAWLEKQGEKNPVYINNISIQQMVEHYASTDEYDGNDYKGKPVGCMIRAYRQGLTDMLNSMKQKPINDTDEEIVKVVENTSILDMVEPKFKVGDWVVYDGWVCQITDVKEDGYCNSVHGFIPKEREEVMRLWTIQDAKDGDVLVDVYGNIGMFEKHDDFDWSSYYSLGYNRGFQCFKIEHENEKTYPATKEQRDLLFQKMKEAGYKWDADNKKLKKEEVDNLHNYLYGEQKPEWSEEDKQFLLVCKNALAKYQVSDKWDANIISRWLENKLKSLKPQSQWKPSDEQINLVEHARELIEIGNNNIEKLNSLIINLKKLKKE